MPRNRLAPAVALITSLLWAAHAQASGFATARFGGELGHPLTNNPTAVYYNPAGLAAASGLHLYLDGSLAIREASFDHNPGPSETATNRACDVAECDSANNGKATLSNVLASPMVGASLEIAPRTVIGAAFYVPFGGVSMWDKNEIYKNDTRYAGPYDGSQRWYSINGTIKSTYLTLAAAHEIKGTGLSIGLSASAIQSVVDTVRARTADGGNSIVTEGRSYADVKGWQFGFGAGVIYEAMPDRLWLGGSYQSRPNVAGGMRLKGTLATKLGTTPTEGPVNLEQDLPDIIRLGGRFRVSPVVELRLFGDYTRWSSFKSQCIADGDGDCDVNPDGSKVAGSATAQNLPRNWTDAFGVRAGVSYWARRELELLAGAGYDSIAIPDENLDPALLDFHDISVAVGGRYQVIEPLFVAVNVTQFFYISRDTTEKSINPTFLPPSRGPDAGGIYDQSTTVINANLEAVF